KVLDRRESKKEAAEQRHTQRKGHHTRVQTYFIKSWNVGRCKNPQEVNEHISEHNSRQSAETAHEKTFRKELAHQPAASGAHRGPKREFRFSLHRTCQEQVSHVGARNQ